MAGPGWMGGGNHFELWKPKEGTGGIFFFFLIETFQKQPFHIQEIQLIDQINLLPRSTKKVIKSISDQLHSSAFILIKCIILSWEPELSIVLLVQGDNNHFSVVNQEAQGATACRVCYDGLHHSTAPCLLCNPVNHIHLRGRKGTHIRSGQIKVVL